MKPLKITSLESLDTAVAEVVRLKIWHKQMRAQADAELAEVEKHHQAKLTMQAENIATLEEIVRDYCAANRAALFSKHKSRETNLAVFGFELTPPRVETASRKIKWRDVVERLIKLPWGKAYIRHADPMPDKNALLDDRQRLTPEQQLAAGIVFCQDEQFFIRPKPETADDTTSRSEK